MILSAGDICKLTGIAPNTLDRWTNSGLLSPQNNNRGTGRHRVYSLADAIAVTAGLRYRDEGAGSDRVAGVVRLLASMPLEKLEAHLDAGETFPVPAMLMGSAPRPECWMPGMMIAPPDVPKPAARLMKKLDLKVIHRDVIKKADKLGGKTVKQRRRTTAAK